MSTEHEPQGDPLEPHAMSAANAPEDVEATPATPVAAPDVRSPRRILSDGGDRPTAYIAANGTESELVSGDYLLDPVTQQVQSVYDGSKWVDSPMPKDADAAADAIIDQVVGKSNN